MFGAGSLAAASGAHYTIGTLPEEHGKPGFKYNGPVGAALLPSLVLLAGFGGSQMAAVLMVGAMAVYILDGLRQKEGALGAAWLTLALALIAGSAGDLLLTSPLPTELAAASFLVAAATLFLAGLWVTLQFRWILVQRPVLAAGCERLLVCGSFPAAAAVMSWGLVAAVGAEYAAFYMVPLLTWLYHALALPLAPSALTVQRRREGRQAPATANPAVLQDPADGAGAWFLTLTLPAGLYVAAFGPELASWTHAWSVVLLAAAPALVVCCMRRGLWWLGDGEASHVLRRCLLLVSLALTLAALEARVLFMSYGQYIRLPVPWNYIAVTIAVYGVAVLLLLHALGVLSAAAVSTFLGPVLMGSAAIVALALGAPLWLLPAPLAAAAGMTLFYESRRLVDYVLFTGGVAASAAWFLHHHYWFLDINVSGVTLRTLCSVLGGGLAVSLILGGAMHAVGPGAAGRALLIRWGLIAQAVALAWTEQVLSSELSLTLAGRPAYPPALVAATSAAGLLIARRLAAAPWMTDVVQYLLVCIYASKLSLLVLPKARLLLPVLGLALASMPPLLMWHGSGATRPVPPPTTQAALAAACVLAVAGARFAVFDVLRAVGRKRPGESALLGSLALLLAAAMTPAVQRWRPEDGVARRGLILLAGLGGLLLLLRPPLPAAGGAACPPHLPLGLCPRLWDDGHIPAHERDAADVFGSGLRRSTHAPLWLLVGAGWTGLWIATGGMARTGPGSTASQHTGVTAPVSLPALAGGGALGLYVAAEHCAGAPALQALVLASCVAAAIVMAGLQRSKTEIEMPKSVVAPAALLVWLAGLPLALMAAVGGRGVDAATSRLFPDRPRDAAAELLCARQVAVLATWACQAGAVALALKLRVERTRMGPGSHWAGPSETRRTSARAVSSAAAADERLVQAGLAWAPAMCNVATMVGAACVWGLTALGVGPPAGAVAASPLLLLLTRDAITAPWLHSGRRYAPPAAAAALALNVAALVARAAAPARSIGDVAAALRDVVAAAVLLVPEFLALAGLFGGEGMATAGPPGALAYRNGMTTSTPVTAAAAVAAAVAAAATAAAPELGVLGLATAALLALQQLQAWQERVALRSLI